MKEKAIIILSGGMDSTALLYLLRAKYDFELIALTFDYGQKHRREIAFAEHHAKRTSTEFNIIPVQFLKNLLPSALTSDDIAVQDGEYAPGTLAASVVPNRNSIMLNIAAGIAVSRKAKYIALGVHDNDTQTYPDCRPGFIKAAEKALKLGNEGYIHPDFAILAPFIYESKGRIISKLLDYYPLAKVQEILINTYSCYKGGKLHCGKCSTCLDRQGAFKKAEVTDLTTYAGGSLCPQ